MKSIIRSASFLLFFLAAFNSTSIAQTAEVKIKTSAECEECKERIEKMLAFEKGIKSSTLNLEDQVVTVVYYDKRTNPQKIREAISNIGYDADEIKAKKEEYDKLPSCCKKGGMR